MGEEKIAELERQLKALKQERQSVCIQRERKLPNYSGRDSKIPIDEWREEAELAIRRANLDGKDAARFLITHLEGSAQREVRYTSAADKDTPDKIFAILESDAKERQTNNQLLDEFMAYRQGEKQSIKDYSHELMSLLDAVERSDKDFIKNPDKFLRDQFIAKLRDSSLRRELQRSVRNDEAITFRKIREEAYRNEDEERGFGKSKEHSLLYKSVIYRVRLHNPHRYSYSIFE